jgi:hypothetical protein
MDEPPLPSLYVSCGHEGLPGTSGPRPQRRQGRRGELRRYREEWYPIIRDALTVERVKQHFDGICLGPVERYELPNLWAVNFVLHNTLGGGGTVSLKLDAQGKTIASAMLLMEIDVPDAVAATLS